MTLNEAFDEVIELEYLDEINRHFNGDCISISILMFLAHQLNQNPKFIGKYYFKVISYGFMGYYPALGVQYAQESCLEVGEDVIEIFINMLETVSLKELYNFTKNHMEAIAKISEKIKVLNSDI